MDKASVMQAERERDQALLKSAKDCYEATTKADDDFETAPKRDLDTYRQTKQANRAAYEAAIKAAEIDWQDEDRQAEAIYSNAPSKARTDCNETKRVARETYKQAQADIESTYNKAIEELTLDRR